MNRPASLAGKAHTACTHSLRCRSPDPQQAVVAVCDGDAGRIEPGDSRLVIASPASPADGRTVSLRGSVGRHRLKQRFPTVPLGGRFRDMPAPRRNLLPD